MVYVGSKRRIKKEIIPIIEMHVFEYDTYVEPFVGGVMLLIVCITLTELVAT